MTTGNTDIDTLTSEPTPVTLVSGTQVNVERLKTRALMSLLKILTRGAAEALPNLSFSDGVTGTEFAGQLLGAVILAIPEAEDETIEFVNRMVTPVGVVQGNRLSKADAEANVALQMQVNEELYDPEIEDLITIVTRIVEVESPHILALGKRLGVLLQAQQTSAVAKQGASSKRSSKN